AKQEPAQAHAAALDTSVGQAREPFAPSQRARDRNPSVMDHYPMQPGEPAHQADEIERHRMALKIVDEPATTRRPLHPTQKLHDLSIGKMVREQTADDEIRLRARVERENIGGVIFNSFLG